MVSENFADDLVPEKKRVSKDFADGVLFGKTKPVAEPDEGGGVFGFIPDKTSDEVLRSLGVDPKSPTLAEDIRKASTPYAQSERLVIGAGKGFKDRMDGIIQRGLEVQSLFRRTGIPLLMEPAGMDAGPSPELTEFTRKGTEERELFAQTPTGQSTAAAVGETAAYVAPLMILPGAPRTVLGATATGGGIGATSALTPSSPKVILCMKNSRDKPRLAHSPEWGSGRLDELLMPPKGAV